MSILQMLLPCQIIALQLAMMTMSGRWVLLASDMCMKRASSFHIVALTMLLLRKVRIDKKLYYLVSMLKFRNII